MKSGKKTMPAGYVPAYSKLFSIKGTTMKTEPNLHDEIRALVTDLVFTKLAHHDQADAIPMLVTVVGELSRLHIDRKQVGLVLGRELL